MGANSTASTSTAMSATKVRVQTFIDDLFGLRDELRARGPSSFVPWRDLQARQDEHLRQVIMQFSHHLFPLPGFGRRSSAAS